MSHKYHAKKVILTNDGTMFEVDELKRYNITDVTGIKFDSKMEAEYYLYLVAQGYHKIELQPVYVLQEKPKIKYIPDFRVWSTPNQYFIVDVKGTQTTAFRLKMRLFKAKYPDERLLLATRKGRRWEEVSA